MFLDNLNLSIQNVFNNSVIVWLLLVFLTIASYTDIKSFKIPNVLNGAVLSIGIIFFTYFDFGIDNIIGAIVGMALLLIPAMIKMHKMGGDIKTMTVIGFFLGVKVTVLFIYIVIIVSMTYLIGRYLIKKKVTVIPFAPFFLISFVILDVYSFLIKL